jgi:hypothetical protein
MVSKRTRALKYGSYFYIFRGCTKSFYIIDEYFQSLGTKPYRFNVNKGVFVSDVKSGFSWAVKINRFFKLGIKNDKSA